MAFVQLREYRAEPAGLLAANCRSTRQAAGMGASSLTLRTGLSATTELGATFVITTAPVAMMLLSPIVTPGQIVAKPSTIDIWPHTAP